LGERLGFCEKGDEREIEKKNRISEEEKKFIVLVACMFFYSDERMKCGVN